MKHLLLLLLFIGSLQVLSAQSDAGLLASADTPPIELRVYPNPATDYIQLNNNNMVQLISIYNLAGRQVKSFVYANHERYFIGDLPKGMYLVQLLGNSNERIATRRLHIR